METNTMQLWYLKITTSKSLCRSHLVTGGIAPLLSQQQQVKITWCCTMWLSQAVPEPFYRNTWWPHITNQHPNLSASSKKKQERVSEQETRQELMSGFVCWQCCKTTPSSPSCCWTGKWWLIIASWLAMCCWACLLFCACLSVYVDFSLSVRETQ